MKVRESRGILPKVMPQNFRAQAGAAHTQQQTCEKPPFLISSATFCRLLVLGHLLFGDAEPAQPVRLHRSPVQECIALPEAPDFAACTPVVNGRLSPLPPKRFGGRL